MPGHEIASHGYGHKLVYSMARDEFKNDVSKSCHILEDITGEKVYGFRAPSWSVKKETLSWFYDVLEEVGLKYSSSVYPAYTFLYGISGFPKNAHYPVINGKKVGILEIPVPVLNLFGKNIGFSGGFFLRFFPVWFIKDAIFKRNKERKSVFLYLHPREIDVNQSRLNLSFREKLIHYWGINGCEKKFESLVNYFAFSFIPIKNEIVK